MKIARKTDWNSTSITNEHGITISVTLSELEFKKLSVGMIPHEMEDKWFIYMLDNTLHAHRSWTGREIFRVHFEENHGKFMARFAIVERNEEFYKNTSDEVDKSMVQNFIKGLSERHIVNYIEDGLLGLVAGDALGVPVEFKNRKELDESPIIDMIGYGTYNQPPGTWSDDSSLALCTAEQLLEGVDIQKVGEKFTKWLFDNEWTPHGNVFDIGISTSAALQRIKEGTDATRSGDPFDEHSNGNGSLMRILPILVEFKKLKTGMERYKLTKDISSITHAHVRSCLACYYYLELAASLSYEVKYPIKNCIKTTNYKFKELVKELKINPREVNMFQRLTECDISELPREEIKSSGYVIHTLEAAIWCLSTSSSYKETVLKAVNLGEDTDTTGAVAGGLAGIFYGVQQVPKGWLEKIARLDDIYELIDKLSEAYGHARC